MSELLNQESIRQFLEWEQASRDTIDVKRVYIDLAGDLVTGILLSQIIFWFLPQSGESKLRVERDGRIWLAKLRADWWDECRISPKQFDRSINILRDKSLVETRYFMFNRFRTLHIWLDLNALVQGVRPLFTKGEDRSLPKVKTALYQRLRPITETTNIDYLTEIKEKDIEPALKALFLDIAQLPYWGKGDIDEDITWLVKFLSKYPELSAEEIERCRNRWDGRRASHRGIWKHRLDNWMRIGREIKASPQPARLQRKVEKALLPTTKELKEAWR